MIPEIQAIWRHPIKGLGRERLAETELTPGQMLPWDRHWAITHKKSKLKPDQDWQSCSNFLIGCKNLDMVPTECELDVERHEITLRHPRLETITANPDQPEGQDAILDFVRKLDPPYEPQAIYHRPQRGMSDTDFPSVSLMNMASLRDLSRVAGTDVSPLRWRVNIWFETEEPWLENEWIGQHIKIGDAILKIEEPIKRCKMTTANPMTGEQDLDTLKLLRDNFGHQNFGIYARIIQGGMIRSGDKIARL